MIVETLNQETVYRGRAFNVRRDQVRFPNQYSTPLDIIEHPGAVTILPVDAAGRILFVRQYRHATGKELLELPAGTLGAGEPPEVCARREIREETGFAAENLVKLGEFFLAPGYSTEYMYVYLATGLSPDPLPGDQDEFLTLETIPAEKAYEMAAQGELMDGKSLAALLLARQALRQP
ncbi:MAG: ADP-ribose pyrophosphatase [Anaerolineales bacterium]|nr:MAG: ADP-ribose pyrophosphatase [Anaerolineales bacterium]